ncbi:hypothetical protein LOTGIDRAFT_97788, partial [Lottia gigantea]
VIEVKCNFQFGSFTFIQHKNMDCKEVDFNRGIQEYIDGFGEPFGEHWIGLQHIHDISQNRNKTLLSVSLDTFGAPKISYYYNFKLQPGPDFRISLSEYDSSYSATAGDSLTVSGESINERPFSAYDRDNTSHNCPARFESGWWY